MTRRHRKPPKPRHVDGAPIVAAPGPHVAEQAVPATTGGLPLSVAASALGISPGTLRRWIAQGAPVTQRGQRGRGCRTLVCPDAVRAWRAASAHDARLIEFAGALPELVGKAMADAYRLHPDKRQRAALAWLACAGWQLAIEALTDELRHSLPGLPAQQPIPEAVAALRKIAHGSRDY